MKILKVQFHQYIRGKLYLDHLAKRQYLTGFYPSFETDKQIKLANITKKAKQIKKKSKEGEQSPRSESVHSRTLCRIKVCSCARLFQFCDPTGSASQRPAKIKWEVLVFLHHLMENFSRTVSDRQFPFDFKEPYNIWLLLLLYLKEINLFFACFSFADSLEVLYLSLKLCHHT